MLDLEELETQIELYLETLDKNGFDSFGISPYDNASDELNDFLQWLQDKAKNSHSIK